MLEKIFHSAKSGSCQDTFIKEAKLVLCQGLEPWLTRLWIKQLLWDTKYIFFSVAFFKIIFYFDFKIILDWIGANTVCWYWRWSVQWNRLHWLFRNIPEWSSLWRYYHDWRDWWKCWGMCGRIPHRTQYCKFILFSKFMNVYNYKCVTDIQLKY